MITSIAIADAMDDDLENAAVRQTWQDFAEEFWVSCADKEDKAPRKLHRTKVWSWLVCTWTMLVAATGRGWDQFIQPEKLEDRGDPLLWPSLTLSIDQGGDGFSAAHFLFFSHANLILVSDTSHRTWNDCQLAIHDVKMWYWCLCVIVMLNYENGPWDGCRWWEEIKTGCSQWLSVATYKDKLWQGIWPNVMVEKGIDSLDTEAECEEHWTNLSETFAKKSQRVGMCRWFQFVMAVQILTQQWSQRLVVLIFSTAMLGGMKEAVVTKLMDVTIVPRDEADDVAKCTTKDDHADVSKVRKSCKNTSEFCLFLLGNRWLWKTMIIMSTVMMRVQDFHSNQNKDNRSAKESAAWWQARSVDLGLPHLNNIVSVMCDEDLLRKVGCHLFGCASSWEKMPADDALVEAENDLADLIGSFAMCILARRLRSCAHWDGYPSAFPRLCADATRKATLQRMQEHKADWAAIQEMRGAFWVKLRERSPMAHVNVQQIFAAAEQAGWTATEEIQDLITKQRSGITQTKLVEDGVREERAEEPNRNFKKTISGARTWTALIKSKVIAVKHRFQNLPWQAQEIRRGIVHYNNHHHNRHRNLNRINKSE